MKMEELEVTISPEGKVSILVKGIKGKRCVDITKTLEDAIGEVENRTFTSEYYLAESVAQSQKDLIKQR